MEMGDADLVWRLMGEISHCMLISHDGRAMRARPMAGLVDRDQQAVWFLCGESLTDDLKRTDGAVCLSFVDDVKSVFLSVSGASSISSDPERVAQVKAAVAERWHNGKLPSPNEVNVIRVTPTIAEYWRHPTTELMIALDALTSGATHSVSGASGVNGKVEFRNVNGSVGVADA